MISEEKMIHIVHLMIDGIWKEDIVDYSDEDEALKEAKKVSLYFVKRMQEVEEIARKRIESQKNAPPLMSPQWEILYKKYYEEEMKKVGG